MKMKNARNCADALHEARYRREDAEPPGEDGRDDSHPADPARRGRGLEHRDREERRRDTPDEDVAEVVHQQAELRKVSAVTASEDCVA